MTKYQVTANPNATNSELDAKVIVYPELPDFNEKLTTTEHNIIEALCKEIVWLSTKCHKVAWFLPYFMSYL